MWRHLANAIAAFRLIWHQFHQKDVLRRGPTDFGFFFLTKLFRYNNFSLDKAPASRAVTVMASNILMATPWLAQIDTSPEEAVLGNRFQLQTGACI